MSPHEGEIAATALDVAKVGAAAIPFVGGSIVEAVDVIQGRRERRVLLMHGELIEQLGDRVSILEDVTFDDRLADLIEDAVEAAVDARGDTQVRVLGRILARAIAGIGETDQVEPTEVLFGAVASLRAAHIEVLQELATQRNIGGDVLEFPTVGVSNVARDSLAIRLPHLSAVLDPLLQELDNRGLATLTTPDIGGGGALQRRADPRWGATRFGVWVLNELLAADRSA